MLRLFYGPSAIFLMVAAFSSLNAYPKKVNSTSKDSIVVNRMSENKNYQIELSSGDSPRKLLISVNNQGKKVYHFYLFDTDGKLKAHVHILKDAKISFMNIDKGSYYYEILCNDERVENGQLIVK